MNFNEITSFLWGTADLLRNTYKQHEYGGIILPFTVMRRVDITLKPTKEKVLEVDSKTPKTSELRERKLLKAAGNIGFYNTSKFTMESLRDEPDDIQSNLVNYITGFSPDMLDVFDKFDIYDVIKKLDENDLLFNIVDRFCEPQADLGPESVTNAQMGDIYEELIRKFSEVSNETAGEHFSPRDGLALASELLIAGAEEDLTKPYGIVKAYDPCAGTGGALTVFEEKVHALNEACDNEVTVVSYAQEINDESFAICKSDIMLKGGKAVNVHKGDTLISDMTAGETFGYQISNPPYGVDWKKEKDEVLKEAKDLGYSGRFGAGLPRISDGQLLFVQHMVNKMRNVEDGGGRIAVFLNGSPLFTGTAGSGESEIRRYLLEHDLVEAIVAMPNDFFFNTGIATYIWVITNNKEERRKGKVQLINANGIYTKMRKSLGSKRVELSADQIKQIVEEYKKFEGSQISKIFDNEDFGYKTVKIARPLIDEETGEVVCDRKGKPKKDAELSGDTENIPLKDDIEDYLDREVRPYAPGAWIDPVKDKRTKKKVDGIVGYEIPFARYFYEYKPLRSSSEILADLEKVEASIAEQLQKARA